MSKTATALLVVGVILLVAGIAFIALDYSGAGDQSGLDYKDVALVLIGVVLAGIGAGLRSRAGTSPPAGASP